MERIRIGLRSGITFGIIIIFLSLIGFTTTAVDLFAGILGSAQGQAAAMSAMSFANMAIFMAIMGLWAGVTGARRSEAEEWQANAVGGLSAGVGMGLIVGVYSFVIGSVNATGVDMRVYLVALGSNPVTLFLYGLPPLAGALAHVGLLAASGLIGGVLVGLLVRGGWRQVVGTWLRGVSGAVGSTPAVQRARQNPWTKYILYAALIVGLFTMPSFLGQYWNYNMGTVGIYVLLGLGLNIVVGMAGLLDLGYVAFFAIGAYTVALLTAPNPHHLMWSFWTALPIGIALAALAGILLGIPVLRMRGDYLAIVTLGFGEIIRILSKSDLLTAFSGGPRGVRDIAVPILFGHQFDTQDFMYLIIVGCLLVIFITARLQNSRVGRAWVAMREDETVAQAMGINTWQYKLMAFAMGAALAGLGGVLFASRNQFTGPEDHNLMVSINVLCVVIVGGMGSIPGVIMGALALKGLPEILRQLQDYRLLAFGGLLVAMMIVRPEGLWPSRRRRMEMHRPEEEVELPEHGIAVQTHGDIP